MSYIWLFFLAASLTCGVLTGQVSGLSGAAMQGAQQGAELCLSLCGALCLWSGAARVMEKSGLTQKLSRVLSPLLSRIFPETCRDAEARGYLCANFTANLLGLGSAATPMGVGCVHRMQTLSPTPERAGNASIQLLPTTVAALRAGLGADSPFEILPAVWVSSVCSVAVGLLAAALLEDAA